MATTKAIRIHAFGGPEQLRLEDFPYPEPKDDEVVIKVLAAGVNPVDWKIRNGTYPFIKQEHLPVTLGRDVSGVVEVCGPRAGALKKGDEVFAFLGRDRGGYAEYVVVQANERAAKPRRLSHVEAAAVPLAGLTAWQGLFDIGGLAAGERVLIHAGNGGVGHFAVQFAKAKGAWVASTCSVVDMEFVKGLGADQVIDYRNQRFEEQVQPVDLVFDLVAGETRERSFAVIKPGGRLVSALGQVSPVAEARAREKDVRIASVGAQPNAAQLAEVAQLLEAGKVKVEVQATFGLKDAARAHKKMETEHTRGKVVLDLAK